MSDKDMNEKGKACGESALEDFEKDAADKFEKFFQYEKSLLWKKYEDYQKNLLCIQDVAERLLSRMKGHGISFKPEITDGKGKFSQEKLSGFVEGLLSRWAAKQREGTFTDPSTGESMAEPYIRARQELYGCYLYLVMRCSLSQPDYDYVVGGGMKLRTDFAFLLEQARRIARGWCVMEDVDGSRRNELFWGYDNQFGLHLYRVLSCPAAGYDNGFDWPGRMPVDHPAFLTDEGNVKRNMLKRIYVGHRPGSLGEKAAKAMQPDSEDIAEGSRGDGGSYNEGDSCVEGNGFVVKDGNSIEDGIDIENGTAIKEGINIEEDYDIFDDLDVEDSYVEEDDYDDYMFDAFEQADDWRDEAWYEAEYEARQQEAEKSLYIENLSQHFEHSAEYVEKCRRFVELFRQAGQDVLRGFSEDLEEIVALYLAERDIPPLMDTDKVLDVYSGIYDGPCRKAERYARGVQWKNL